MKIYTGNAVGSKNMAMLDKFDLGIMIASSPTPGSYMTGQWSNRTCALDNGAYTAHSFGYPFNPYPFLATLAKAMSLRLKLSFVVCPDIPRSSESLAFSLKWATDFIPGPNLALAVQDGMTPAMVEPHLHRFSHIFVGGSDDWRWRSAPLWIQLAHDNDKQSHIGKVGTLPRLREALSMGADSVDSVSFVRNQSWHILEEFSNPKQTELAL